MKSPIVLIVAMESERRHLDDLLPGWEKVESPTWSTLRNGDVLCVTSGIGMTMAAAAAEYAISTYSPSMVLNYGCAGAHTRELYPGDVVIGDRLVHHGRMRFTPDGTIAPITESFHVPGEPVGVDHLESDRSLIEILGEVAANIKLPVWPTHLRLASQQNGSPRVHVGTVSSGDIWMQDPALIDAGHARTGSLCEDMEAASIAHVCAVHGVPFATVKDISNSEFHEATQFEGATSGLPSAEVGLRSAMLVAGLIQRLHSSQTVNGTIYS